MSRQVRRKKCALGFIAALILSLAGWPGHCFAADASVTVKTRVRATDVLGPYAAHALRQSALAAYGSAQSLSGGWSCDWVEYCTVTKADGVVTDVSCGDWQQENCQYDPGDIYNPGDGGHDYWGGSGGGSQQPVPLCWSPYGTNSFVARISKADIAAYAAQKFTPVNAVRMAAADWIETNVGFNVGRQEEISVRVMVGLTPAQDIGTVQFSGSRSLANELRKNAGGELKSDAANNCRD